ncbi:unnamed protein product, partial [Didymodactylos carnosus]
HRYSNDNFEAALQELSAGAQIRATAKKYNIPYSTLQEHNSAQVSRRGAERSTHFTDMEESYLVKAVTVLQQWGEPVTSRQLIQIATYYAQQLAKHKSFQCGKPGVE